MIKVQKNPDVEIEPLHQIKCEITLTDVSDISDEGYMTASDEPMSDSDEENDCEISPSGTVYLETLDREPMANFINGSCLRMHHEPLTDEMLEKMHTAKNRKEAQEQMKQEALTDGRECTVCHHQQRPQIKKTHATKPNHALPPTPMLTIVLETPTNSKKPG